MRYYLLFSLICINLYAQPPMIDGVVDSLEWAGASRFSIGYEIEPADNAAAPYNTDVFITTTPTDILVGFIAQADMSNLRSSVRSRDEINDDENVAIGIDTYGDGRAMIVLGSNPEGSQFDIKILPNGSSDDYNMAFETLTSKHKDSYHVEFRIPIRNFSFSSDDTQRWKLVFVQPLLKWNPNPFTLFYACGSHGYRRPEVNPSVGKDFELENSQLYIKFQYLFDI